MGGAIGPGDWLICINASGCEAFDAQLEHGREYQIEAVWDFMPHLALDTSWMDCAVSLVGIRDPRQDLAWGLYRFTPKGDLESLLRKATEPSELEPV